MKTEEMELPRSRSIRLVIEKRRQHALDFTTVCSDFSSFIQGIVGVCWWLKVDDLGLYRRATPVVCVYYY